MVPNRICNGALPSGQRTLQRWFDTSCFTIPSPYTYGNSAYLPVRGPNMVNMDFSIFRGFKITDRRQLTVRAEAFNITNTPGFGQPNGNIGSATAGVITSLSKSNRQLQLGMKFMF